MSWLVHVEGVSNMIQLSPPESFESGIEHTLFIGFRPLLVLISQLHYSSHFRLTPDLSDPQGFHPS